jgi:hypothetical protein
MGRDSTWKMLYWKDTQPNFRARRSDLCLRIKTATAAIRTPSNNNNSKKHLVHAMLKGPALCFSMTLTVRLFAAATGS